MRHVREAGYCARGAREFFARRGWDYPAFLADGIDCDILESTGDALALRVAELARREAWAAVEAKP